MKTKQPFWELGLNPITMLPTTYNENSSKIVTEKSIPKNNNRLVSQ